MISVQSWEGEARYPIFRMKLEFTHDPRKLFLLFSQYGEVSSADRTSLEVLSSAHVFIFLRIKRREFGEFAFLITASQQITKYLVLKCMYVCVSIAIGGFSTALGFQVAAFPPLQACRVQVAASPPLCV